MQAFLQAPWNQAKLQNVDVQTLNPTRVRDNRSRDKENMLDNECQDDINNGVTDSNSILAKNPFVSRDIRFKIMNPN